MLKLRTLKLCAVSFAACLQASESVCLRSGFCLAAESHVVSDRMMIVQRGEGTLQFPIEEVEQIFPLPAQPALFAISSPAVPPFTPDELLISAAVREGLRPEFVRSVAKVESGLRPGALSPQGAFGLMQLMPYTATRLGVDAHVLDQNVKGGAAYLRQLLLRYKGDLVLALAAYNAGPGAVEKYKGVPPYSETRKYIVRVLAEYNSLQPHQSPKGTAVR